MTVKELILAIFGKEPTRGIKKYAELLDLPVNNHEILLAGDCTKFVKINGTILVYNIGGVLQIRSVSTLKCMQE